MTIQRGTTWTPQRTWVTVEKKSPTREGYYTVYIDQSASNTPDTIQSRYWDGECWGELGREQRVTHWRDRCAPPKGTWMARCKKRRAVV